MTPALFEPYVRRARENLAREYPNQIVYLMRGPGDRPERPKSRTPVFYGSFDWHSAVHGHWLLARVLRAAPEAPYAEAIRGFLVGRLRPEPLAREAAFLSSRPAFERPYGLAWLLALDAELRRLPRGADLVRALEPVSALARERFSSWLPKLSHPVRSGVHSQTAFSLGLVLDWARVSGAEDLAALAARRAESFFGQDRDYPLHLEPSGEDFLSPSLGAADLMRRVLPPNQFADWLGRVMPDLDPVPLLPVTPTDRSDGRLVHLDGLCLSRAFMLNAIASVLPGDDPRVPALEAASGEHAEVGLRATEHDDYAGTHWLGTFAVYLLTQGS